MVVPNKLIKSRQDISSAYNELTQLESELRENDDLRQKITEVIELVSHAKTAVSKLLMDKEVKWEKR